MSKKDILQALKTLAFKIEDDQEALKAIDLLVRKIKPMRAAKFTTASSPKKNEKSNERFPLPKEIKHELEAVAIFSDGACRGNPGPGAWGVVAQDSSGAVIFEGSGIDLLTTNNKMELEGAIWGLQRGVELLGEGGRCLLYSDSKYVIDGINKWAPTWKKRGWKKADKKIPENIEQWKELDELANILNVDFHWVKGHAGHPQNEYCDQLANDALDQNGY